MLLDVGVVGGGLCGLATSYFLLRSGRARVTLYDAGCRPALGFSRTASAVAGGLLHPLTPSLKPAWAAREALAGADALVDAASALAPVVASDVLLRPAVDLEDAETLRATAAARGPEWLDWRAAVPCLLDKRHERTVSREPRKSWGSRFAVARGRGSLMR